MIRYCPICDGPECEGKRVAVLGAAASSLEEAIFLRTFTDDVTLLAAGKRLQLDADQTQTETRHSVNVDVRAVNGMSVGPEGARVTFENGETVSFDVVYPCLGSQPRSDLAVSVGAEVTPSGGLLVDSRQQTNIPMLYAAGDVLEGLDQIASACGQAAIAATAIHNHLRREAGPGSYISTRNADVRGQRSPTADAGFRRKHAFSAK